MGGLVVSRASFWKADRSSGEIKEADTENQTKESQGKSIIQETFIYGAP